MTNETHNHRANKFKTSHIKTQIKKPPRPKGLSRGVVSLNVFRVDWLFSCLYDRLKDYLTIQ